jgi:hypothetical protein
MGYERASRIVGEQGVSTGVALRQRVKQCLRILQVCRIKPFREPVVDWCQEVMGFLAFAVLLPQASQAGSSSQLKGLRLLVVSNGKGMMEAGFGCSMVVGRLYKEAFTLKAMDIAFVPIPTVLVHKSQCLRERLQGVLNLSYRPIGIGEEGKVIREESAF